MSTPAVPAPKHETSTSSSRRSDRELAAARQAGTAAPEVDIKTGKMINPHNPEFITKRPWYLGGTASEGASLDHQATLKTEKELEDEVISLAEADRSVALRRQKEKQLKKLADKSGKFTKGMWVEALFKGKRPFLMAEVIAVNSKKGLVDLRFDDKGGKIVKGVKTSTGLVRATRTGTGFTSAEDSKDMSRTADKANTYASKRDAYHGYDINNHDKVVEKFNEREEIRKKKREKELEERMKSGSGREKGEKGDKNENDNDSDDSDYDSDDSSNSESEFVDSTEKGFQSRVARQGGVGGAQMMVTARNLRIREDTAKYLRNLDPNSAFYDPKSRSMRDNPNPERSADDSMFMGDNFARVSGDAVKLANTQLFAWDAEANGVDAVHPQACPSAAEVMEKKFVKKSGDIKVERKKNVLEKYGGSEYLDGGDGLGGRGGTTGKVIDENDNDNNENDNAKLTTTGETNAERMVRLAGESATETEFGKDGRAVRGGRAKQVKQISMYEEDKFENGHVTIYGSYFHRGAFRWGYADDHSVLRNSYCTGANGRIANDEANSIKFGNGLAEGANQLEAAREMLKNRGENGVGGDSSNSNSNSNSNKRNRSEMYGEVEGEVELDKEKLKEAMKKEKERMRRKKSGKKGSDSDGDDSDGEDENKNNYQKGKKKPKYNSLAGDNNDVTVEEMEAYRLTKQRAGDVMDNLGEDELLEYK